MKHSYATRSAPELLRELLGQIGHGTAPPELFGSEALHQYELQKLFAQVWSFVAFESEIPHPGDFVLRRIGNDRFIVVRGDDGEVRVMLDRCSHRGAHVCRADKGNANDFTCPYHGWTYNNRGELMGVPLMRQAYGQFDKSEWGLRVLPRTESLHGFIFASLQEVGPTLEEWLGDARWYLDAVFGCFDGPMEVVGEPQRWVLDSNWKAGSDNFVGDDYHTVALHRSMFDVNSIPLDPIDNMKGYHIALENGHGFTFSVPDEDDDIVLRFWGYPEEITSNLQRDDLNDDQWKLIERSRVTVGTLFPNLSFLTLPAAPHADVPPTTFMSVRQWHPISPGRMEAFSWMLVPPGASDEFRRMSYLAGINTFGPAGTFEQDDTVPWSNISRNGRGIASRTLGACLNYKMGLPGQGNVRRVDDWPGPGVAHYPRWEEGNQRNFWRVYAELMLSE